MPSPREEFNSNILSFNQKYGVTFREEDFARKARSTNPNIAYWDMYSKLATTVADRKLAGENLPPLYEMLEDYEKMLFTPYKAIRDDEDIAALQPEPYGGTELSSERAEMLKTALESKKTFEYHAIAKKYKNGDIRIRDIVAFASEETGKDAPMSNDTAVEILKYALALEEANKSRSFIWKVFHPFRNNAEQRDSALIKRLVSSKLEDNFDNALWQAKNSVLPQFAKDIDILNYHIQHTLFSEAEPIGEYQFENENEKPFFTFSEEELKNNNDLENDIIVDKNDEEIINQEFVNEDSFGEAEDFILGNDINVKDYDDKFLLDDEGVESKQDPAPKSQKQEELKKQDEPKKLERPANPLARIGYRPPAEITALRNEGRALNKLLKLLNRDGNASQAELTVVQANYDRYLKFYGKFSSHPVETARAFLKNNEETYAQEDAALRARFPSYDPLPKEEVNSVDNGERININLDLNEDKNLPKSEPIHTEVVEKGPPYADK